MLIRLPAEYPAVGPDVEATHFQTDMCCDCFRSVLTTNVLTPFASPYVAVSVMSFCVHTIRWLASRL